MPDLDAATDRLAAFLIRSGTKIGDRVGILLNKSPESLVSLFGILKAGAAYVPIDPQIPAARARFIIENCELRALITSSALLAKLTADEGPGAVHPVSVILADQGPERTGPEATPPGAALLGDLIQDSSLVPPSVPMSDVSPAYVLYTSGSTGVPKGVVISHANALAFVDMAASYFDLSDRDRFASHAPFHFDLSVLDIYVAVSLGAAIVLVPEHLSAFPVRLVEFIRDQRISVWNSVSSVLVLLASKGQIERFVFEDMRLVHFSGDVLPLKYLGVYKRLMPNAQFFNIYGQTEANSSLGFRVTDVPASDVHQIPIGKPFPNFEVFAMTDDNEVVSRPDQVGELHVKSSTVAAGYWREPEMTAEKFVPDPRNPYSHVRVYKTGDLARTDKDGNFYFIGRKDHMVKSRGYRIELPEVEHVIAGHPLVRHAAVVAVPDEMIGHAIIAYVSLVEGAHAEAQEIAAFCQNYLPKYMVPESIEFRESLPMTSSGKIDRKALAAEALSKRSG